MILSEIFFRDFYFLLRESQHFEYDTYIWILDTEIKCIKKQVQIEQERTVLLQSDTFQPHDSFSFV